MKANVSSFQSLEWDSKLFGYNVAKINDAQLDFEKLKEVLINLTNKKVKLVYWFVNPLDRLSNKAATTNQGFLVDQKIISYKNISHFESKTLNNKSIRSYLHKKMNRKILSLGLQSGFYSRFNFDSNFKKDEFRKLYQVWVEKSLNGEITEDVIVYLDDHIEKGFITLESKTGYGNIGLFAVDKNFRRKSIGVQLINAVFLKFKNAGLREVKVTTQKRNKIACRFYEKLGFIKESTQNIYHFWLNG